MSEQIIQGITASEGIQIGLAYHYDQKHLESAVVIETISEAQVDLELERLQRSKDSVARSLDEILERHQHRFVEKQMAIIKGHKGLLDDPSFMGEMVKLIRKQLITSEKAVQTVVEKYVRLFQGMEKEYLRERAQDIQDVGNRLLEDLLGKVRRGLEEIEAGTILIAHDLTPSDTIQIDPDRVLAFITKIGGKTSHTAILARSMGMPALVGIGKALDQVYNGDVLIVDGKAGICIIHPEAATIMEYEEKRRLALEHNKQLKTFQHVKAETSDGVQFEISTNIGSVEESMASLKSGAEGVGLFRTEFMYMNAVQMPTEEDQYLIYKEIVSMWNPKSVIIRTLDIGGDKELPYLSLEKEENPFLGYRAIRIGLHQTEILFTQLRAILRASAHGKVKIMFPMISSLEEWRLAKSFVTQIAKEFDQQGISYDRSIPLGIMAEIPSVVQLADLFAKEVDFFSIGTNDLVQYTLAVDRMNEKVAYLYDHFHPAVLRSIKTIIDAAHRHGKWVGMCGAMAGDVMAVPVLVGLGLDEWSMEGVAINRIKAGITQMKQSRCIDLMEQIWSLSTTAEVRKCLENFKN